MACFQAIERLEIREIYTSAQHSLGQVMLLNVKYRESISTLLVLRGLKKVTLTAAKIESAAPDAERLAPAERLKGIAVPLFEKHRSAFLSGDAPRVNTRVWQTLDKRSISSKRFQTGW
ncbi:hypothetical protein IFR05_006139 [Cadophora sp. M221]|nr:hypothetical protein IFR05_006139 [Cadophora sp. M221]